MGYNINAPVSRHFFFEDSQFTYLISGTIDPVADIGKAVSWDTTQPYTVKLAADGDKIVGRLEVFENRTQEKVQVATVSRRFKSTLPIKAGLAGAEIVASYKSLVGAGGGFVKAAATLSDDVVVMEIVTNTAGTFASAEKI